MACTINYSTFLPGDKLGTRQEHVWDMFETQWGSFAIKQSFLGGQNDPRRQRTWCLFIQTSVFYFFCQGEAHNIVRGDVKIWDIVGNNLVP